MPAQLDIVSGWYLGTHQPRCSETDLGIWPTHRENGLKAHWFLTTNRQNP